MDIILNLPEAAKILKCGVQDNKVVMWAEVNTEYQTQPREFSVFGTGWDMADRDDQYDSWKYIDTVQMPSGLVWHIYEIT